ncbi:MAG: hypothetical protein K0S75_2236 [Clostridia bacterium]|jgi:hypothetical protein|nr:hypothetical protein [Clostridia bacterium]
MRMLHNNSGYMSKTYKKVVATSKASPPGGGTTEGVYVISMNIIEILLTYLIYNGIISEK